MKKSELKALLRIIAEEVVAAKQAQLNETKGLSGMKKAPESTEHTEKVADSKDLTGAPPKEKEEGKKLPVVKKPANPQKVGSIKEDILQMIREAISELDIDEVRKAGAVDPQYRKEIEPGKWVIMGHPNQKKYPDGTPTFAPKGPYIPKGENPNLGRQKNAPAITTDKAAVARTEDSVENILKFKPSATEKEIADELANQNTEEAPLSLDASVIANAITKAKEGTSGEETTGEPDIAALAAKERAAKEKTIRDLRAYLLRKRGMKPAK